MIFKTPNIFKNTKTGYCVDFGTCLLMYKVGKKYTSDTCNKCYAAQSLTMYPALQRKIEKITNVQPDKIDFAADIAKIKPKQRFIRFYGFGDFRNVWEIDYIKIAAQIMPVEIFSKVLHHSHIIRDIVLPQIAQIPNVHISLSFNKNYSNGQIKETFEFLKSHNILHNCQLNYTFIQPETYRKIPYISVYHTTSRNKVPLIQFLGKHRVCCARTESGKFIQNNLEKGSCLKCPLCKLPAADVSGNILTPKLLKDFYVQNY